jgi:hypothetical protein
MISQIQIFNDIRPGNEEIYVAEGKRFSYMKVLVRVNLDSERWLHTHSNPKLDVWHQMYKDDINDYFAFFDLICGIMQPILKNDVSNSMDLFDGEIIVACIKSEIYFKDDFPLHEPWELAYVYKRDADLFNDYPEFVKGNI